MHGVRYLFRMPRTPRSQLQAGHFHCINRGVNRQDIFFNPDDYNWFAQALVMRAAKLGVELNAVCLMPNHWHIVATVQSSGHLSQLFGGLLNAHTRRHHAKYENIGHGPIYQGRYKSIPIKDKEALVSICRYVRENAVRASLAKTLSDWPWSWGHPSA
jgi:putative transposase